MGHRLGEHVGGDVLRGLGDEGDVDALRTDLTDGQEALRRDDLRCVGDTQVGLRDDEQQLGHVEVADQTLILIHDAP